MLSAVASLAMAVRVPTPVPELPPSLQCRPVGVMPSTAVSRQALLRGVAQIGSGCLCCSSTPLPASALATLVAPDGTASQTFDVPRDARKDAGFACGMATGMKEYEAAVAPTKGRLFAQLWKALPPEAVVVELGMGSFPNAPYYAQERKLAGLDIVGVDPNDSMASYAKKAGKGLEESGASLRIVHGVSEVVGGAAPA